MSQQGQKGVTFNSAGGPQRVPPGQRLPTMASTTRSGHSDSENGASNRTFKPMNAPAATGYVLPNFKGFDDSTSTSAGYVPFVTSFFKPVITPRGKKPRFVAPTSGVPPKIKTAYGYYRAQHKETAAGAPITLWYFYEIGDGPYGDIIFGSPLPDGFWVRRENAPPVPDAKQYAAYDNTLQRPKAINLQIRFERQDNIPTGQTSASEMSDGGSSFTAPKPRRYRKRRPNKQAGSQPPQSGVSGSEYTDGSESEFSYAAVVTKPKAKPAQVQPQQQQQPKAPKPPKTPRDNVKEMQKRPVHARSMLTADDPAEIFSPLKVAAVRAKAYEDTRLFFPTRHFLQHFANVYGEWAKDDHVHIRVQADIVIDGSYPEDQLFFNWLMEHGYMLCAHEDAGSDVDTCVARNVPFAEACRLCQLDMYKSGQSTTAEISQLATVWEGPKSVYLSKPTGMSEEATKLIAERDEVITDLKTQMESLRAMVFALQQQKAPHTPVSDWGEEEPEPQLSKISAPPASHSLTNSKELDTILQKRRQSLETAEAENKPARAAIKKSGTPTAEVFNSNAVFFTPSESLDITKTPSSSAIPLANPQK